MDNFTKTLVACAAIVGMVMVLVFFLKFSDNVSDRVSGLHHGDAGRPSPQDDFKIDQADVQMMNPAARQRDALAPRRPAENKPLKRYRLSPRSPFYDLSDEERNSVWWEIAGVGKRNPDDEMSFTLDVDHVNVLARKYGCTTLEIFEFFRAGRDSDWLKFDDIE